MTSLVNPSPPAKKRPSWTRRLLRIGAWLFAAFLVFALFMPYWLGSAIRLFVPEDMVRFETYKTAGYGRFQLRGIEVTTPAAVVRIDNLEALSPGNWAYRALIGDRDALAVSIGKIELELLEGKVDSSEDGAASPKNLPEGIELLDGILAQLDPYLESLHVAGVRIAQGERSLAISNVEWIARSVSLEVVFNEYPEKPATISVSLQETQKSLVFELPSEAFSFESALTRKGQDVAVETRLAFQGNLLEANSLFGSEGWLPESADWHASQWELASSDLRLDSVYSNYNFDFEGAWDGSDFENRVTGQASQDPVGEGELALPNLDVNSLVKGNLNGIRFDAFSFEAPGLSAAMKESISFDFESGAMDGRAQFDIDLDLSVFGLDEVAGILTGTFEYIANEGSGASGQFILNGSGIRAYQFNMDTLAMESELNWPILSVSRFDAQFTDSSYLSILGEVDLEDKSTRTASISGHLEDGFLEGFLPAGTRVAELEFELNASGPWDASVHSGMASFVDLENAPVKTLTGKLAWEGVHSRIDNLDVSIDSERGQMILQVAVFVEETGTNIRIEELTLRVDGKPFASLNSPVEISALVGENVKVEVSPLALQGPNGQIDVGASLDGTNVGSITLGVRDVDLDEWLEPWVKLEDVNTNIQSFDTKLSWSDGPVEGNVSYAISTLVGEQLAQSEGTLEMGLDRVLLDAVSVSDVSGPLFSVSGELPIAIYPADTEEPLHIYRDAEVALDFMSSESETLNAVMSEYAPFEVGLFTASATLTGSLGNPKGAFDLTLQTKEVEGDYARPSVGIEVRAILMGKELELERVGIDHSEESFEAAASVTLPIALADLLEGAGEGVPWLETLVSLEIAPSSFTPLSYFAPQILGAGGTIEASVLGSIAEGFDGRVSIENLNTRSIFPFGAMREIQMDIDLSKRIATLERFSGNVGREPLVLEGWLNYDSLNDLSYELTAVGNELPLVRQSGLLLRAGLDVSIEKKKGSVTKVDGAVILEDGLFLMDTTVLLEGGGPGGRSAASRPPYFSVEASPLSEWELDVDITGEHFMQVQTPAAQGLLSIDMKMEGTLGEPFVIGEVIFEDGELLFPFAGFYVEQGLIDIRIDDPYTPILNIRGESRRFGYDLEVEITGSAFDPQVQFRSSPPLSSEQVLLMVMAGENPEGMFDYSATQRASKLGSYLSKGIFSSGGSGDSRFSLSSGANLSEQGKETLEMEYRLSESFQFVGEYDEYDAWNGGIRWRVKNPRKKEKDTVRDSEEAGDE